MGIFEELQQRQLIAQITNEQEVKDLINSGNWGYNGSSKLFKKIKSCKNCVFFLDENEIDLNKQTDQKLLKYVIDNGCIKEEFGNYKVYMLGDKCGED